MLCHHLEKMTFFLYDKFCLQPPRSTTLFFCNLIKRHPNQILFCCWVTHYLSFSKVLFLLVKRRRSRVFLFRNTSTVPTRRLSRVTRIATVMATLSADATYDNTHIITHTRTSTAQQWQNITQTPLQLGHGRQHILVVHSKANNTFSFSVILKNNAFIPLLVLHITHGQGHVHIAAGAAFSYCLILGWCCCHYVYMSEDRN